MRGRPQSTAQRLRPEWPWLPRDRRRWIGLQSSWSKGKRMPSTARSWTSPALRRRELPRRWGRPTPPYRRRGWAGAVGGMIGALAAFTITRPQAVAVLGEGKLTPEEIQALKENVVQARVELAAL